MTTYNIPRLTAFIAAALLLAGSSTALAQRTPPLEAVGENYRYLAETSLEANPGRSRLDSINFPWTEYGKGAIGNALWRTVYLLPGDERKLPSLIKLPKNSSEQTARDIAFLLNLQNNRTTTQIERAQYIANIGSWPHINNPTDPDFETNRQQLYYIINTATGKDFNYKNYPRTTQLLLNCIQDIRVTEFRLKQIFKRPRPYHLEPTLNPLTKIQSPSFPSGHSLWAYTGAYIFGELFPEQRANFLAAASEVQWSREVLGIHYPSDNEASRIIGWHLLKFWYNNPTFKSDLEAAKTEWKK